MNEERDLGWRTLAKGYPWFTGEGRFPIHAYSEFMPPPRLGKSPYGEMDIHLFSETDPFGWRITELEEEYELQPGLLSLAQQIVREVVQLGQGKPAVKIAGRQGRNLLNNPYWPPELAARAGKLPHERYVVILPLSLSRTQDDKGRVRWTLFGSSEQGPERAFWKSFYSAPGQERPSQEVIPFLTGILSSAYGEACDDISSLSRVGFRILPTEVDPHFPYWHEKSIPSCVRPLIWSEADTLDGVRYLLTFRPFSRLPAKVSERYLAGQLNLLPFPGSMVFWGIPVYIKMQAESLMAIQLPLQRIPAHRGGPDGIRVPQSGYFHESGGDLKVPEIQEELLVNTYKRHSRSDRAQRFQNEVVLSTIEDTVARVLFGTKLDSMGLYGKPMARNAQIWTEDSRLLLDGPRASRKHLEKAIRTVAEGGTFRYRYLYPAMQVGTHEVYWQRPLVAYWSIARDQVELTKGGPLGYLTAYDADKMDLAHPVELWPRLLQREPFLWALRNYNHLRERYPNQTMLNALRMLDTWRRWGQKPMPRSLARQVLRIPERDSLETWLAGIPEKASNRDEGLKLLKELEHCLEPLQQGEKETTSVPGDPPIAGMTPALTYDQTATRKFEEAWWNDISYFAGKYLNKNNADCIGEPVTPEQVSNRNRDLERLGDFLISRYRQEISAAGMEGQAVCGEMPFKWTTDHEFSIFGGWQKNQEGHTYERNIVLIIPGRNHNEAVVMADHYDTAYRADVCREPGAKARIAAAGADDNFSATATLLQAAPVLLKLSRQGLLERDIWLVHLTGEEFPADCMGARHLAGALVEKTVRLRLGDGKMRDLSSVEVVGVYVLDMIGHNRDSDIDEFQISPGKGRASLRLAWQAHLANALWNMEARKWNLSPERRGKGRGKRISGGIQIPPIARHLRLQGEVRLNEDPRSTVYNTDAQIFSDCGIPVVLFMESYDINRSGYHDDKDTMENIDLDYGAAVAAISIETVARLAAQTSTPAGWGGARQ